VTGPRSGSLPDRVEGWPGRERRDPPLSYRAHLTLRGLSRNIAASIARDLGPLGRDLSVLDVGCHEKPYLPLFTPVAREYVGVDVAAGPYVDVVSPAESLPFPDARFDAVCSFMTLEHVPEPAVALREIHRVLKPGGIALVAVPVTTIYHPMPTDYWRWTQEGLVKVIHDNGDWSRVDLHAAGGTMASFGHLIAFYVAAAFGDRPLPARVGRLPVAAINVLFGMLDRVVPLHYPRRYTLIPNFLAVAEKHALP
jgi:SAM-dependent methyltransferase